MGSFRNFCWRFRKHPAGVQQLTSWGHALSLPTHRFPGTCWGQQPVASSAEVLAHRKLFALHEMPGCLRFGHETGKLFTSV